MPKVAKELSAIEVKRLVHPGHRGNAAIAVGGVAGLLLQITPSGARTWILRTMVGNKRRGVGLGGYPTITVAMARERARESLNLVRQGIDPVEHKKAARSALIASQKRGMMFSDACDKYLEKKLDEFRNEKHKAQWQSTLETYADPAIGAMLVSDVTVADIQRVLEPIWTEKTETASRLRGRIENVLAWATVAGHRTGDNPARWRGNLDAIFPKPGKLNRGDNQPALALTAAPAWFADLRSRDGIATRALEFLAITAARSGEIRGAVWSEIDLDARLWVIPAARMKMDREHRVPLTHEAVALLKALPRFEGSEYVFPAARGGALSDAALSACMKRINAAKKGGYLDPRSSRPAVPHGLRSTFRDWAAERTEYPREMAEIALAHSVGSKVERAYLRSDMLDRRRFMAAAWVAFLTGKRSAKVVQITGAR